MKRIVKMISVLIAAWCLTSTGFSQNADTLYYTGSIESWVVPAGVTDVTIEARGAEGGFGSNSVVAAGKGAIMIGDFTFTPGDTLRMLVGESPVSGNGGGGGTFVVDNNNNPLIIAGGGGGSSETTDSTAKEGNITTIAGSGAAGGGTGGMNGNGGNVGTGSFQAGAGGGLLTDGEDGNVTNSGGGSFLSGGLNTSGGSAPGGYGGGGSGSGWVVGGGGGGYSGGGSGGNNSAGVGGGGASFNVGTNQNNTGGVNTGDGLIIITYKLGVDTTVGTHLICNGLDSGMASITIFGGFAPYSYHWSNGSSTTATTSMSDSISSLTAGIYTVTVSDNNGDSITASISVTQPSPLELLFATTNTTCEGGNDGEIDLVALGSNGGFTYSWSTGDTTTLLTGLSEGSYTVTVTDQEGCSNSATEIVNFNSALPMVNLGSDTAVGPGNTVTLSSGYPGDDNLWNSGETTESIDVVVTMDTTLWVTVTTAAGCIGSDTISINVALSTVAPEAVGSIKLYPNPTHDQLNIQIDQINAEEIVLQVLGYNGQLIQTREWSNTNSRLETRISLGDYSQGIYFINLLIDGKRYTERVTVY